MHLKTQPLDLIQFSLQQQQQQKQQSNSEGCLYCAILMHVYSNYCSLTLAFHMNFAQARVQVCLGEATPLYSFYTYNTDICGQEFEFARI